MKLEKAMLRKLPSGPGGALADVASAIGSMAAGAAADVAGASGMVPVVWGPTEFHFRFNPTQLSTTKDAILNPEPAQGDQRGNRLQYGGSSPMTFTVAFLLDEWEAPPGAGQDVREMVGKLEVLTRPEEGQTMPPRVMFVWGSFRVAGYLKQVTATYKLFRRNGTPARADVSVQLYEHSTSPAGTNPTSGGPPGRRSRGVIEGDSLATIAYTEYGDPKLWRAIAVANGIDDPLAIRPGDELLVPSRKDAEAWR
jgi:hypothetical protein